MFSCVYVLESKKDDERHIEFARNLKKRLEEHNKGFNFSTKLRLITYTRQNRAFGAGSLYTGYA